MRITKAGIICLLSIVVCSILIGNFLHLINVENGHDTLKSPLVINIPVIDDSPDHIIWFTQVSDLHLSIFQDNERGTELFDLCDYTMKHINPSVILATGDLTDAKKEDMIGSAQFEEEWAKYKSILDKCNTTKSIPWLDIRGNHDNFDVPSISSKKNFFLSYSMQGKRHSRSYVYHLTVGMDKFAFLGVDACPAVGLKRPFNFIGVLPDTEIQELNRLRAAAMEANYTIWFGHYPTSCILSRPPGIRSVIASNKNSIAYLCGHFHSMLGMVPNMYTLQKGGFYELELADWKDNRMFRIAAIDHGLFSFVDVKHHEWPIVLVTNPKDALFHSPSREPLAAMLSSTHMRMLVFSPSEVLSVRVRIDNKKWESAKQKHGPLYILPWTPSDYLSGLHSIHIKVKDKDGREKSILHHFSLDGTRMQFKVLPRILLMLNFSAVMQVLYGLAVLSCVIPYCFLRYMNKQALESKKRLPALKNAFVHRWLKRIWIFSNIDALFYPIVLYPLYISIGPWAVAELLDGEYGIIFIWGIFVHGTFIPGSFTYGYAFIQLFLFHGPLVSFTAYALEKRLLALLPEDDGRPSSSPTVTKLVSCGGHVPYAALLVSQLLMAYAFYLAYGLMAVVTGPIRLWPIALVFWVWYQTKTISSYKIKHAARVWDRRVLTDSR